MPLKRGGGNHMQLYDPHNGEYTDQEKAKMRQYDDVAIMLFNYAGEKSNYKFHFPVEGVHEKDYCKDFIRCIRSDINNFESDLSKMHYLFSFRLENDKSKFIKGLGYSEFKSYQLLNDILFNTKRDTIEFSRFSHGAILLKAKTILKGKTVKTIWRLDEKLNLHFVTLIPGGCKHG